VRAPSKKGEYFLYQAMLGTCPAAPIEAYEWNDWVNRLCEYIVKSVREEKVHTNWTSPNVEYEEKFIGFIKQITTDQRFLENFLRFKEEVAFHGLLNSLSQTALNLMIPGVPDIYQGTELLDFSFVDPDNRRAVDFGLRKSILTKVKKAVEGGSIVELIEKYKLTPTDGKLKLLLTERALKSRSEYAPCFAGDYIPVETNGRYKEIVIAFLRKSVDHTILVIVPRFTTEIANEGQFPCGSNMWSGTSVEIPQTCKSMHWKNLITGEILEVGQSTKLLVGETLRVFPIGIFVAVSDLG